LKAVPKNAIPPGLDAYRTAKPQDTWDMFRDGDATSYKEVRTQLRKEQGRLCAYCELSLEESNEQVAHFHPKSDTSSGKNWAFEWDNLWLACKGGSQTWMQDPLAFLPPLPDNLSCDEFKGSTILDGLVLAPNDIPAFPRSSNTDTSMMGQDSPFMWTKRSAKKLRFRCHSSSEPSKNST